MPSWAACWFSRCCGRADVVCRFLASTALVVLLAYAYVLAMLATWPTAWWLVVVVGGALGLAGVGRLLDWWVG